MTQSINCAHQLPGTEMHGHTYRVTVIHDGKMIPEDGLVIRLETLREQLREVLEELDHRQLEPVIGSPATAEQLALFIQYAMKVNCRVRVEVGDDGWVETE